MKRKYITPCAEIVNVKLINSVLGPGDLPIGNSPYGEDPLAKEHSGLDWDDPDFNGDLWDTGDGGDSGNSYDLWGE